jgi:hypothetical protein
MAAETGLQLARAWRSSIRRPSEERKRSSRERGVPRLVAVTPLRVAISSKCSRLATLACPLFPFSPAQSCAACYLAEYQVCGASLGLGDLPARSVTYPLPWPPRPANASLVARPGQGPPEGIAVSEPGGGLVRCPKTLTTEWHRLCTTAGPVVAAVTSLVERSGACSDTQDGATAGLMRENATPHHERWALEPRRSGTCSPTISLSHPLLLREAPFLVWS